MFSLVFDLVPLMRNLKPEEFKNDELRFWLQCRGDPAKGLKNKAQLAKRRYFLIARIEYELQS